MVMKALVTCWVFLAMVVLSVPAQALESLVFYDDFEADLIDPNKWFGVDFGIGIREAVREIRGNRLRVAALSYGLTDTAAGRLRSGNRLSFLDPAAVTAIEATVRVKEFEAAGCATSGSAVTLAIARLQGSFFNSSTPTAGSAVNDVFASIDIRRQSNSTDPPDVLRVFSFVRHCANPECLPLPALDTSVLHNNDLGTVERGQKVRLRIQWDPDNDRFIFQRDGGPEVFFSYALSDAAAPGRPVQGLDVTHFVANCTAEPRPVAFMDAMFDDVFVNESAAP